MQPKLSFIVSVRLVQKIIIFVALIKIKIKIEIKIEIKIKIEVSNFLELYLLLS